MRRGDSPRRNGERKSSRVYAILFLPPVHTQSIERERERRALHKAGIEDRWIDRDPPGRGREGGQRRERPRRGVRVGWDRGAIYK